MILKHLCNVYAFPKTALTCCFLL